MIFKEDFMESYYRAKLEILTNYLDILIKKDDVFIKTEDIKNILEAVKEEVDE
jgi:hypothetical protein